ncbi:hypothetical protein PspLS_08417 [Pyricularia sp. CBS 133598]|nr:hypothetical protein PspLS_08417 [Pyricularia sp. CBS 133598]
MFKMAGLVPSSCILNKAVPNLVPIRIGIRDLKYGVRAFGLWVPPDCTTIMVIQAQKEILTVVSRIGRRTTLTLG